MRKRRLTWPPDGTQNQLLAKNQGCEREITRPMARVKAVSTDAPKLYCASGPDRLALLTSAQMGEVDHLAAASQGRPGALLEAAGAAVAVAIGARWSMRPVTVLCGPGNNGGDGFIAAWHLSAAGWAVTVALMGSIDALSGDAAHAASHWTGPIAPFTARCLDGAGIVVDAIFGAGLARPITGAALELIEALKQRGIPICAIDVPSGVDGSTGAVPGAAAPADLTVTFFRKKPGHLL
jgi:hydroxyethylthiazole kinase-like uncharacterized protein yjeF